MNITSNTHPAANHIGGGNDRDHVIVDIPNRSVRAVEWCYYTVLNRLRVPREITLASDEGIGNRKSYWYYGAEPDAIVGGRLAHKSYCFMSDTDDYMEVSLVLLRSSCGH